MGEFIRDRLPEPEGYFQSQGLVLAGRGRWRTTRCTFHGGSDSMRINTASGGWCCMSCGEHGGDVLAFHQRVYELDFVAAARELGAYVEGVKTPRGEDYRNRTVKPAIRPVEAAQHERLADYGYQLLRDTRSLRNTVGADYLKARGCVLPPEDGDLRFHPALRHPSGYVGPALVALVTDVVTREPRTLLRTWIGPDGRKAEVDPPRLLLGGHRKAGGCIRLWPDECVSTGLAVAEGIESALSLAHAYQPVWSLIDAGNLAALPVLPGIEWLVIGADNDPSQTGTKAADQCACRWYEAGARVRIAVPPKAGTDFNDIAKEAT